MLYPSDLAIVVCAAFEAASMPENVMDLNRPYPASTAYYMDVSLH